MRATRGPEETDDRRNDGTQDDGERGNGDEERYQHCQYANDPHDELAEPCLRLN